MNVFLWNITKPAPEVLQDVYICWRDGFSDLEIRFKYVLKEDYMQVHSEKYRVEILIKNAINTLRVHSCMCPSLKTQLDYMLFQQSWSIFYKMRSYKDHCNVFYSTLKTFLDIWETVLCASISFPNIKGILFSSLIVWIVLLQQTAYLRSVLCVFISHSKANRSDTRGQHEFTYHSLVSWHYPIFRTVTMIISLCRCQLAEQLVIIWLFIAKYL